MKFFVVDGNQGGGPLFHADEASAKEHTRLLQVHGGMRHVSVELREVDLDRAAFEALLAVSPQRRLARWEVRQRNAWTPALPSVPARGVE